MGIFFIQIINNIMMKLLALFFLIALAFADDTKSACVPAGTTPAACTTSSPALELNTFTYVNVTAGATVCSSVAVDSDDISDTDNVFVLATRPGEDYAGVGTSVTTTAYNTNGTATSCVKLQGTEVDDDTDYACSAISTVTATMYVASANTDAAAFTSKFMLVLLKVLLLIVPQVMFLHLDQASGYGLLLVLLLLSLLLLLLQQLVVSFT